MRIEFTPEQEKLRQEIRRYYRELFTPELRAAFEAERPETGGPVFREIVGRMGQDGWLGIGWPVEFGGQGRGPIEQFIFWDETYRARAPLPIIQVNSIGPTLMEFGSDAQKRELLPRILKGELVVAMAYSEPGAGTDLASLATRAVRDGDEYVINGQKVFTTFAHDADLIWLAARTDPDAPKHRGISILLVPTDASGLSVTPIRTVGRERTNATYYADVRVPASSLVGPENGGWTLITSQLKHERIALATPGFAESMLDAVWRWTADARTPDGGRLLDEAWVQLALARVQAKLRALQVLAWRSAWAQGEGLASMAEASALKVMGSEFFVEAYGLLLQIAGSAATVVPGEPGALLGGLLEEAYRGATTLTFGGGVNEVQRDIIATAGLGLPPRAQGELAMDFRPSEEQTALCALAREILAKEATPERLRAAERSPEWFDRALWERLADANLLGVAVPEAYGGIGLGFFELCALLVELGRAVAPLPALPALAMGGLAIARFGRDAQQARWLEPLAQGRLVLTAALEPGPSVRARGDGAGFVLDGSRACVPAVHLAQRVLVPARHDERVRVFLVDPAAPGVAARGQRSSRGESLFTLELAGVRVAGGDVLDGPGIEAWMTERTLVALAATQLGVAERALEITTSYLREREQFGAPLGALQAVQQRCADCFIDLECLRGVVWKAAYELAQDRAAARDAWIAKFWAAEAGSRIANATQHLHGGIGADVDYPIHRHFLWSKCLELAQGAALPQLAALGREMARTGPDASAPASRSTATTQ